MTSRILVDTNILLWSIFDVHLSPDNKALLENAEEVYVSCVSLLEIRIKQEFGQLPLFDAIENTGKMSFAILPFSASQAGHYQLHDPSNKDPFDNALISIAVNENLQLMTSDKAILTANINGLVVIDASRQ